MYDIYLCDDDEFFCKRIHHLLESVLPDPSDYCFRTYTNLSQFLKDVKKIPIIDILLMDIQFPNEKKNNGYTAAEIFRKYFSNALLIFCSGVYDITPDVLFHTPFRYIKKEMSDDKIIQTLSETVQHLREQQPALNLLVYQGRNSINLSIDDITYIARNRGYCMVHLSEYAREKYHTDCLVSKQSLPELQALLSSYHFSLPHNSYLVNLKYVWKSNYNILILSDETELNISRSKIKKFKEDILEFSTQKYLAQRP